jgi:hypothetical protein
VCVYIYTGGEGGGGEEEGRGEAGRDAAIVLKSQQPSIFKMVQSRV